jgi:hypothetical protein
MAEGFEEMFERLFSGFVDGFTTSSRSFFLAAVVAPIWSIHWFLQFEVDVCGEGVGVSTLLICDFGLVRLQGDGVHREGTANALPVLGAEGEGVKVGVLAHMPNIQPSLVRDTRACASS